MVPKPHQVTESHGEIHQGDALSREQLLSENCQNVLALNNLLNPVDNPVINNSNTTDQDDDLDAAETASVVSALSTEEFHVDLHSDLRTALGTIPPSSELEKSSISLFRSASRNLRHTIRRWLLQVKKRDEQRSCSCENADLVDVNEELYYLMDYMYAEESLSGGLKALKGSDLAIMACLDKLADELGFDVYIFRAEKMESGIVASSDDGHREGYYDQYGDWNPRGDEGEDEDEDEDEENEDETVHFMEEVLEREFSIKKLVDLTGRVMNCEPEIDLDILQERILSTSRTLSRTLSTGQIARRQITRVLTMAPVQRIGIGGRWQCLFQNSTWIAISQEVSKALSLSPRLDTTFSKLMIPIPKPEKWRSR
ncbi:hypothetical protein V8F33_014087 [Rhypophila sp. PSN 637]